MAKRAPYYPKLAAKMAEVGATQESMSMALGMTISTFNVKYNGKSRFDINQCKAISQILGGSIDDIFLR